VPDGGRIEVGETQEGKAPRPGVSEQVRAFYETMPYPAPLTSLDEHRDLYSNPDRRRALFHVVWPTQPMCGSQEILVAGCGTSQAARYALRERDARITAIDISETSLRYTRDLQRKYDLENLDLHRLPLENIQDLGRTFDHIVCTGVLHHLPDPNLGLRALRNVLRRQGAMHLMVYAPYGRAGIYMMQEYCRMLGISSSEKDLRDLGTTLEALPADHPLGTAMRAAMDFRHPDALADALLHPLDRAYTVPNLYAWLERCGMSFGRWVEQAPYLAQCGMIAKTPLAPRLASFPAPLQHAAVELFRGTMVRHKLIAYRDDRAGESQPITFVGDHWREYVPICLPWTVCIRERVPPGSVAVLINRAHAFPDLVLTVDATEDRLLGAIDGKRTLAEISECVTVAGRSERQALGFFERLWQYDQIVFDASRAT
jgi:SAM-dependent methyltransferase